MSDNDNAYAIAYIKQAIAILEQPVQYTADVNYLRELTNRVSILRADVAWAKKSLEKALVLFEKQESKS